MKARNSQCNAEPRSCSVCLGGCEIWNAFDGAGLAVSCVLKMILLSGQRPGEVAHMRLEHIVDDG